MAKRFTDTSKWNNPFLRSIQPQYKLLWLYILDECDHAGVWQVDFEIAQIKIGTKLNKDAAIASFGNRILQFDNNEKWLIYDFIEFQYGELNPANKVHNSVLKILSKYNVDFSKPLDSPLIAPCEGAMDKYKDKDIVKLTKKIRTDIFDIELNKREIPDELIDTFLKIRKAKKLQSTDLAVKAFFREVEKSTYPLIDIITLCIEKSWGAFESSWNYKITPSLQNPQVAFSMPIYDSVKHLHNKELFDMMEMNMPLTLEYFALNKERMRIVDSSSHDNFKTNYKELHDIFMRLMHVHQTPSKELL